VIEEIVRRPVSVVVGTIALAVLGIFALMKLPLSLLPQIERPSLVVVAKAAASARDELLHDVTIPIERRLGSVPGVTSIESETGDGEARITVGSAWQTDPDRLRIDVARRIEGATALPLDEISVESVADAAPLIEVAILGGSGATRSRVAERVIVPELARIEGAGTIDVVGSTPLRVTVRPRAADLAARGLTAADVEQRLRSAGRLLAAGRVREGAAVRPVVVAEPVRTLDELRQMAIGSVPLGEVADVALSEVPDDTAFRILDHGVARDGVLLRVHRAPNANAVAVARAVRARIAELGARTRGVELRVVEDRSAEVARALGELALAVVLGVLLGTLVLRWTIGHWRPTLALAAVIPAALLASFTPFYAAGIALDVVSLAGLALATGLLVDNSIVVLESIETAGDVVRGTRQIVVAVVASSVTLMIVFAPLLYLRGLARAIFGEQAIAVVVSVAASLLLSLTLTPVLARRPAANARPRYPGRAAYLRVLDRALAQPSRALLLGAIIVIAGLALALALPRELFARGAEHHVTADASRWDALAAEHPRSMTMTCLGEDKPAIIDAELNDAKKLPFARVRPSTFIETIIRPIDHPPPHRLSWVLTWSAGVPPAGPQPSAAADVRAALGNIDTGQTEIPIAEPTIRLLPTTPATIALTPVHAAQSIVPLNAIATAKLTPHPPPIHRGTAPTLDTELRDAFAQMRLALILAALLLYLTVAAFYESLLLPLPVMAALPCAAAGAFAALFVTRQSLNLMSLLGLIFLGGVVVNHTVVLLDRAEHLRARGMAEDEAIRRAAAERYRPVLTTTLTALLAMLPLAILGGPGVELRRGIAITVIGGLLTATLGTLVLIPLLHRALEPWRRRRARA